MSELSLTHWQRQRLEQQLRQTLDARVYRRTLALLELDRGKPLSQVAELFRVSRQSVYNWVSDYLQTCDPDSLADRDRPGRPGCFDEELREVLRCLLRLSPNQLGYPHTAWTVPILLQALEHDAGVRPSERTLRRELDRLDYVWKRGRYTLAPDPELEKKKTHSQKNPSIAGTQCGVGAR
jgi:transposase